MRVSRTSIVVVITIAAAMICGCATIDGRGTSAEEDIRAMMVDALEALKRGDIEKAMAAVSDDYLDDRGADKSVVRLESERNFAPGVLTGATFNFERSDIVVEGDNAVASPVILELPMGNSAHEYRFKREGDGVWRVVGDAEILPPAVDLWTAAATGNIQVVRQHLAAGTDLNAMDPALGNTPLNWSGIFGQTDVARMLIEGGADVNGKSREGDTPLHASAFYGCTEIVKLLLDKGADASIRNQNWQTPL